MHVQTSTPPTRAHTQTPAAREHMLTVARELREDAEEVEEVDDGGEHMDVE